jgi:hypothetical protein
MTPAFCANVASMPIDASSVFIRPEMPSSTVNLITDDTRRCPAR